MECRDLKTGKLVFNERVKGPGPTGQNWSSLVLSADGKQLTVTVKESHPVKKLDDPKIKRVYDRQ